jgi:hypothetical protein
MILGIALVLTLLQVGVSFAMPLNQADVTSLNNPVEQSVHILQNFLHEVRAKNQREFAYQQHQPRRPPTTTPQVGATSAAMYIQDRHSGLVFEYKPNSVYQVEIEPHSSSNTNQHFYVIESSFPEYYYIANSTVSPFMRVIAAGGNQTPLFLQPMASGLDRSQLWIFRQPGDSITSTNPRFMVTNAQTGLAMNVKGESSQPGTRVQVYTPGSGHNMQFYFYN